MYSECKSVSLDIDCSSIHQKLNLVCWTLPDQNPVLTELLLSDPQIRNILISNKYQILFFENYTNAHPCYLLQPPLKPLVKEDFAMWPAHLGPSTSCTGWGCIFKLRPEAEHNLLYVDSHACENPWGQWGSVTRHNWFCFHLS